MEPNKLEAQFKEKLESRKIEPTTQAWDRLDAMFTFAEKPKAKFPWFFAAASFVGFLLVGTVFFTSNEKINTKPAVEVVIEETVVPEVILKSPSVLPKIVNRNVVPSNKNIVFNNSSSSIKRKAVVNTIKQNPIAQVSIINQKTQSNSTVTDVSNATIEELLATAESASVKENQISQKQMVRVNASNLLSQVDGELELSFREKVINKVSKNYQTVKVALANRNLE